jgi:hypothetical protein
MPSDSSEPLEPLGVLESDTLLGLLLLGLLPQLAEGLRAEHASARAPALRILSAAMHAGPEAALPVASCAPLMCALRELLVEGAVLRPSAGAAAATAVQALAVVRMIVASSPAAAAQAAQCGLLDIPRATLQSGEWTLSPGHPLAACAGGASDQEGTQLHAMSKVAAVLECLRVWRACALAGVPFLSLDDTMPCILRLLAWAQDTLAAQAALKPPATALRASGGAPGTAASAQDAPPDAANAPPDAELPLYLPSASVQHAMAAAQRSMHAPLEVRVTQQQPPGRTHAGDACVLQALAAAAVQEAALLLVTLLQESLPASAAFPPQVLTAELPARTHAALVSAGCVQQLLPVLLELMHALDAAASAEPQGLAAAWPAAAHWLADLADSDLASGLPAPIQAGQAGFRGAATGPLPAQPPAPVHACAALPPCVLHAAALAACMAAVDATTTPRDGASLAVVADRSSVVSQCIELRCCTLSQAPSGLAADAPLLMRCMHSAVHSLQAALATRLQYRSQFLRQCSGEALAAGAVNAVRAHALAASQQAAEAVLACCASEAMHDCTALAFGPWAAARVHTMHAMAAALLCSLQAVAVLHGGALPDTLSRPAPAALQALLRVPCMTASPATAVHALQLLFSPAVHAPCVRSAQEHLQRLATSAGAAAASERASAPGSGDLLLAGYASAWCGMTAVPGVIPATGSRVPVADPAAVELPRMWMDPAASAGHRLPAPPDWHMLAVAARLGDTVATSLPAGRAATTAAVIGAALVWILGLLCRLSCPDDLVSLLSSARSRLGVRLTCLGAQPPLACAACTAQRSTGLPCPALHACRAPRRVTSKPAGRSVARGLCEHRVWMSCRQSCTSCVWHTWHRTWRWGRRTHTANPCQRCWRSHAYLRQLRRSCIPSQPALFQRCLRSIRGVRVSLLRTYCIC